MCLASWIEIGRMDELALLDTPVHHQDARIIIATHDLEMVLELCNRTIVLDGGLVVADGPPLELLNDEQLMLAHGLKRLHSLHHHHPYREDGVTIC